MAINIDTTSQKYQKYIDGLDDLRVLMLPRMKAFSQLNKEKQLFWLQRDPLLRKLIKVGIVINKHILADSWMLEVEND